MALQLLRLFDIENISGQWTNFVSYAQHLIQIFTPGFDTLFPSLKEGSSLILEFWNSFPN